jgi:hypothetical protein
MFCFFFFSAAIIAVTKHADLYYGVNFNASLYPYREALSPTIVDIETVCQSHNHVTGPQRKSEKKRKIKFL